MPYVVPSNLTARRYASRRCLHCGRTVRLHRRWTRADIERSRKATARAPLRLARAGVTLRAPLSASLLGRWVGHDPLIFGNGR